MNRIVSILSIVALIGMIGGCGGKSYPKTVKVSGTVTLADKPVEGATVTFVPKDSTKQPAIGRTDAQGKFELTSFRSGDGAQPGDYGVTVTKYWSEAGDSPYDKKPEDAEPAEPAAAPAKQTLEEQYAAYEKAYKDAPKGPQKASKKAPKNGNELPARYANQSTSGFAFSVSDKDTTFDLMLVK